MSFTESSNHIVFIPVDSHTLVAYAVINSVPQDVYVLPVIYGDISIGGAASFEVRLLQVISVA